MKKKLLFPLKILVSTGLLIFLLGRVDGKSLWTAMAEQSPLILLGVSGIIFGQFLIATLRWLLLGRLTGASLSPWQTLRLFMAAMFFNQVLPSSLGGDAVRAWLASRQGVALGRAANTVIIDRAAGLLSLLVLMLVTGVMLADRMPNPQTALLVKVVPLFILAAAIATLAFAGTVAGRLDRFAWLAPLTALLRDSRVLWRSGRVSAAVLVLSLCLHALTGLCVWLLARGAELEVSYITIIGFLPPTILMMILPVSIAGWGVREGVMVGLFTLIGVPAATGLAVSLLWGVLTLCVALLGGAIWALTRDTEPA